MAYWLVKGKPGEFSDVPKSRRQTWHTTKPLPVPEQWGKGDTLIMWAKAPKCRVVALAELMNPYAGVNGRFKHFAIRYRTGFFEGPTIDDLRRVPTLKAAYFLKAGPSQTVYPLTEAEGIILVRLAEERRVSVLPKAALPSVREERAVGRLLGAGFGSAEENRRVEKAAEEAATAYLEARGWKIVLRTRERGIGYDLDCANGSRRMHVEVKGIRGSATSFILTAREYREYCEGPYFALCVVTRALSSPRVRLAMGPELDEKLAAVPLAYKASLRA